MLLLLVMLAMFLAVTLLCCGTTVQPQPPLCGVTVPGSRPPGHPQGSRSTSYGSRDTEARKNGTVLWLAAVHRGA